MVNELCGQSDVKKKPLRNHASEPLPEEFAYFDNPKNFHFEAETHPDDKDTVARLSPDSPRLGTHSSMPAPRQSSAAR
eukprot:CAMPEP_0202717434 /NCGR_PEP_ID=MMETSP1385-20130828/111761_1 /ASSEMBLY_ACC=CAM_ASM_000861 /TAXON_ID=933848 /ORGANISM="Elphidium margaritaceum" /LENGTH=77 /DNA_ID=CAMNT_0049379667 /DNA_START=23 /DNA_END=253 /DNA_ORIENTATION=-